jgi:2-(1,2-epoxy-1,2-dihydrophenyl)acetyl-CoA isomerase
MDVNITREHGVEWQVTGAVGHIVLDRPERANALDLHTGLALARAIHAVVDATPRIIVVSARGPIFCAGGDIKSFSAAGADFESIILDPLQVLLPAYHRLAEAPCPVISVVNGPVGGAGIGLALLGDFVLASTSLKLRTGYAAIGLSPDVGASWFLARRIGEVRALQWFMTSDAIGAEACLSAGAVDALHAPEALQDAADSLIGRLLAAAPGSLAAMKRLCLGVPARTLAAHLALEAQLLGECARSADAREGVGAFIEKRAPRFTGG